MNKKNTVSFISGLFLVSLVNIGLASAELPPAIPDETSGTTNYAVTDESITTVETPSDSAESSTEASFTITSPDADSEPATTRAFEDFDDVSVDHPYYNAIIVLRYQGLLKGYEDNTYKPDQPLNRVEALKLVFEAAAISLNNGVAAADFSDTEDMAWYSGYLNKAVYLEVVNGYADGTFRPTQSVNLVEFLKMLELAQKVDLSNVELAQIPYADIMPGQWYSKYINYAKINNLLKTDDTNRVFPDQPLSRARAADIIYRYRNKLAQPVAPDDSGSDSSSANIIPVKDFALYVSASYKIAFQYPKIWFYSAFVEKPDANDIAVYGFGPKDLSTNPPLVTLELLPDSADFQTNLTHNDFAYFREEAANDQIKLSAKINGSTRIYRIAGPHEQEQNMLTMLESLTTNIEGLESYNPAVSADDTTVVDTAAAAATETVPEN